MTIIAGLVALASIAAVAPRAIASDSEPSYEKAVSKAVEYLSTHGQAADGSFTAQIGPGVTAIVTTSLLANGRGPEDPTVAKALQYLEKFVQPSGAICDPKSRLRNYETCLGVVCFSAANKDGRYDQTIAKAKEFLTGLQKDEKGGKGPADIEYGGVGYGGAGRPDLSNTHFLMEALEASGDGPDDEAVKRALAFISRCQNLESEHNTTPFAAKNSDGGFYYTPAAGGSSPAGKTDNGGLRSYGSMTYAGLKSMIFAGLKADDPRVKAAVEWARQHYSLKDNPGLGLAGLYYYYHLMGKALAATGESTLTDAQGKPHVWSKEMIDELIARQQPDGSWVNQDSRWMEGDANLVTGYALLTLSYCKPKP